MSWGGGWNGDDAAWEKLSEAIADVAQSVSSMETEWDAAKLEKKLGEYFRKGSKSMTFRGNISKLVNEYADNVMSVIFSALGDREWLINGQADFLLCLDAGVRSSFPPGLMKKIDQQEFEKVVLGAYDRAFDENRFSPILSECVPQVVSGPKIKKKVWNAIDAGRKEAVSSGTADIEEFTKMWIAGTVSSLASATQGDPTGTLDPAICTKLFRMMLEANGLPLSLTAEGAAPPVELVEDTVAEAYEHSMEEPDAGPPAKKQKKGGGQWSLW